MTSQTSRIVTTCASLGLALGAIALAGPLDPPAGPVAPTYKTLAEVEPRTAVNAANTPGDADSVFRISEPGSYYLTGNITGVSGKSAIEVTASNVTIDLMGFTLQGVAGSLDGIRTDGSRNALTIRNGFITGFGEDGIDPLQGGFGEACVVESVDIAQNGANGIRLNNRGVTRRCSVRLNGADGIVARSGCLVDSCTVHQNAGRGISVALGCNVVRCISRQNTLVGIQSQGTGSIVDCVTRDNQAGGILARDGCTVRGNTCCFNFGPGIQIDGFGSRIEGNSCVGNPTGIFVSFAPNLVIRNSCELSGTANWNVHSGNACLVVEAATGGQDIVGNSGGASLGTTDPNANFSY
jgi:hypothetical protein